MITYKLEKKIQLYKSQFDRLMLDIFHSHAMDRASMDLDALLFRMQYMMKHNRDLEMIPILRETFNQKSVELQQMFGRFLWELVTKIIRIPEPYSADSIVDIMAQDVSIDPVYVSFTMVVLCNSEALLNHIDSTLPDDQVFNMFPTEYFRFFTDSYNDGIAKAYPELFEKKHVDGVDSADGDIFCHNFTFQVTEDCSLNCFAGDTKILMADFTQKYIRDIEPGDIVMGFDETVDRQKQRTLFPTVVKAVSSRNAECITVTSHSTPITQVTADHPYLDARGNWRQASKITKSYGMMTIDFDPDNFYDSDLDSNDYVYGYFMGAFIGDGCAIEHISKKDGYVQHFMRFAVKDMEMIYRVERYADILGYNFHRIPFKISHKEDLTVEALYSGKRSDYEMYMANRDLVFRRDLLCIGSKNFAAGFCAGIYDAEGNIQQSTIRISNTDLSLLELVQDLLSMFGIHAIIESTGPGVNKPVYDLRIVGGFQAALKFIKSVKPAIPRKGIPALWGKSMYQREYDLFVSSEQLFERKVYNFETESHTYIANGSLVHNCTYCYQCHKSPMRMSFDTAKLFIDNLLNDRYGYINHRNSPAIIIEFIGGEPLLEAKLIRQIYEYFLEQCYNMNHPWFYLHRLSICSNGMQYFNDEVQDFFKEYHHNISFNISIDGNKELHDSCRIQPNGEGSYDIDMMALNHYTKHYSPERNSKMTLAPSNIRYLYDSVVDFIEKGMRIININCVFEEGWTKETALEEYNQLKRLADYIIDKDLHHLYIAIFNERQEDRQDKCHDGNFCGGTGSMLSMRPNGQFYPCIRYMPSSVGDDVKDLCIGDVHTGMIGREEGSEILEMMDGITRRSQSNDICYDCPIGNDCAWCSALGHAVFGTPNKRVTFSCIQVIAEALANVYYWNLLNIKHPEFDLDVRKNNVPDEWARIIIDEDELNFLKEIEAYSMIITLERRKKARTDP